MRYGRHYGETTLKRILSILYLRCIKSEDVTAGGTTSPTFNSLFEMLLLRQAELGDLLTATFNSLFEMPRGIDYRMPDLVLSFFQFSI